MAQTDSQPYVHEDAPYDKLNDINIALPLAKAVTLIILVPVILILIYRTERKHVKHEYQLREAKKALVDLNNPDLSEKAREGTALFEPENNFKLVCGSADLKVTEPPRDDLFGLTFRRALKVYRRVEYLQEYVEKEWPEQWDDDEEQPTGPIEVVKQRWVEIRKPKKKIKVNLGLQDD